MTWLLHRYRPFTVASLAALAREELARRQVAAYAADLLWLIAGRLSRGGFDLPAPSRFAFAGTRGEPPGRGEPPARDEPPGRNEPTGAQIVAGLRKGLRALGEMTA